MNGVFALTVVKGGPMPTENIAIPTGRGHDLSGSLELPTGLVRGTALYAHCFTCTKQSRAAIEVARALARHGIACLRFDFTGLGGSGGEFGQAGFASDIEDLLACVRYLCGRFGDGMLLVGHSLGGAAVLAAAGMLPPGKIAAVATIGAPADVPHVLGNIEGDLSAIERDGAGEVTIAGRAFRLSREFLEATARIDLLADVARLRVPLLFCHTPTDEVVGIENAGKLFAAAKHPKSFVSLAGADHLLLDPADAEFAAGIIARWAARYLPLGPAVPMPAAGIVATTGHGRFGTEVLTTRHRFVADEPRDFGGDDTGPSPYDLLTAALGTCTAMTMKMYADRKGWPFVGVEVAVTHEAMHAEDLGHVADGEVEIQALNCVITFRGEALDEEQRGRLMEIADRCPVHRTLSSHLHIHTRMG